MEETLNPMKSGTSHEKAENKKQHDPVSRPEHPRDKHKNEGPPGTLTRLNTSKVNILMEIKDMKELKWPSRMKSPPETRERSKYCEFHRYHGHTTEDCQALQWEIEALIKRGLLRNYIGNDKHPSNDDDNRKEPGAGSSAQPTAGTINIIIGGIASGTDTSSGRKQFARQHTHTSKESHNKVKDIIFVARDLEGVSYPHDDALVVSAIVANFELKRILVDNGIVANILSQEAFAKMGISPKQLKAIKTPLQGFGGRVIIAKGIVELPLTLGSDNAQVTEITHFQVVNTPMAYNVILGRPLQNKIQAIVSTFHLAIKFPTSHGIGVIRGDRSAAKQCYVTSIRGLSTGVMQLSNLELELEPRSRLAPIEELGMVEIEHEKYGNNRSGPQGQPPGGSYQLSVP
ncbi:uncharacterized protein LOC111400148 [Olea europaea var. sylvestris]|uniref:uncharacterized protein LOC111400148 n=1 Tax=Olea europaea var. sylvestris TaxID=158386 RepID=UPI000C1D2F95|nr:uncharacterized protein LOC111400148 [Olea europaea var. sylvestris]